MFLDEIGEMSPYLQAKLLRFLSDGSFRRVGGDREVRVDVRILSATHRNLEKMVAEGSFREDLFYRLNVLSLEVPPLRERGHDILLLARHFMQQACAQIQRPVCRLAPGTYPALLSNRWPGNVRQLQNVIFRAAAICESSLVDIGDLEIAGTAVARQNDGEVGSLEEAVEGFEKALLEKLYVSWRRACKPRTPPSPTACASTASVRAPEAGSALAGIHRLAGEPGLQHLGFAQLRLRHLEHVAVEDDEVRLLARL